MARQSRCEVLRRMPGSMSLFRLGDVGLLPEIELIGKSGRVPSMPLSSATGTPSPVLRAVSADLVPSGAHSTEITADGNHDWPAVRGRSIQHAKLGRRPDLGAVEPTPEDEREVGHRKANRGDLRALVLPERKTHRLTDGDADGEDEPLHAEEFEQRRLRDSFKWMVDRDHFAVAQEEERLVDDAVALDAAPADLRASRRRRVHTTHDDEDCVRQMATGEVDALPANMARGIQPRAWSRGPVIVPMVSSPMQK